MSSKFTAHAISNTKLLAIYLGIYHFKYFVGNFTQYTTQVPGIKWDAYLIENFALQDYDKAGALRAHRLSYLLR